MAQGLAGADRRRDGASAPSSPIADASADDLIVPYGPGAFDRKRSRRPRIDGFDYVGLHAYHLVAVTQRRQKVLRDSDAHGIRAAIKSVAAATSFEILAYVVMPDHVHLLAQGISDTSNAIRLMQRFMQITAYQYKQEHSARLWQQGFFDRVIRRGEDVNAIAQYIIENPRRADLVSGDDAWPYVGGTLVAATDQ